MSLRGGQKFIPGGGTGKAGVKELDRPAGMAFLSYLPPLPIRKAAGGLLDTPGCTGSFMLNPSIFLPFEKAGAVELGGYVPAPSPGPCSPLMDIPPHFLDLPAAGSPSSPGCPGPLISLHVVPPFSRFTAAGVLSFPGCPGSPFPPHGHKKTAWVHLTQAAAVLQSLTTQCPQPGREAASSQVFQAAPPGPGTTRPFQRSDRPGVQSPRLPFPLEARHD